MIIFVVRLPPKKRFRKRRLRLPPRVAKPRQRMTLMRRNTVPKNPLLKKLPRARNARVEMRVMKIGARRRCVVLMIIIL